MGLNSQDQFNSNSALFFKGLSDECSESDPRNFSFCIDGGGLSNKPALMKILFLVGLLFVPFTTWAHLGATAEECEAIYGVAQGGQDGKFIYILGELVYVCDFNKDSGQCVAMNVVTKVNLPLTNAEIADILKENPGEGDWTVEQENIRWQHSSGKWMASVVRGCLVIQ